jgi:hypothetical protein
MTLPTPSAGPLQPLVEAAVVVQHDSGNRFASVPRLRRLHQTLQVLPGERQDCSTAVDHGGKSSRGVRLSRAEIRRPHSTKPNGGVLPSCPAHFNRLAAAMASVTGVVTVIDDEAGMGLATKVE